MKAIILKFFLIFVGLFMSLHSLFSEEFAEVFIFSYQEDANLSYHVEINGFGIPLSLYKGGYMYAKVPQGMCYIKVDDCKNNAEIRTDISRERAQESAISSAFVAANQANYLQRAQQQHQAFMAKHQQNVAKHQNMTFGNHSHLAWMQQSNNQYQTGARKNSVLNKAKPIVQQMNINVAGATGAEHNAELDNAYGIRVEAGKKYYVEVSGVFETKIELLDKNSAIKKITKSIAHNDLSFTGEYEIMDKFMQSPKTSEKNIAQMVEVGASDVDINIPEIKYQNTDTYILIIANEEYKFVDYVNFASHDGRIFKEYCIKTLGVPERHIRYSSNATYGMLADDIEWLKYALNNTDGSKAIVYYCGHGIPDEKTGDAYIIPVDGKGTNTTTCYSLNTLYSTLANTKASNITYFMDACFTGANKEGSMLVAARGVAREAKKEVLEGKSIVFSASSGDETAMTYPSKGHGLFTYFLLKKLQETKGNVSYAELAEYINRNVTRESLLINNKPQTPVVATSTAASGSWKTMTLK